MAELTLTGNTFYEAEMEYHGKCVHTLLRIQHSYIINRIDICYTSCHLSTQNVAPTLTGFQVIKWCIQYMASHPNIPIFYPSNSDDSSHVRILT